MDWSRGTTLPYLPNMASTALHSPPTLTAQQVRDTIRRRILRAAGDRVLAVYLYGSRAKGTARPRSDWDVAVVMRDPVEDWTAESLRLGAIFDASPFAVDLQVFDREEFEADRTTPGTLPSIIVRTGERLYDRSAALDAARPEPARRQRPRVG